MPVFHAVCLCLFCPQGDGPDADVLKALAAEQNKGEASKNGGGEKRKVDNVTINPSGDPGKKKLKLATPEKPKECLFDAHDFDIEIDVDTTIGGAGKDEH